MEYRDLYNQLNCPIANFLYQAERLGLKKTKTWEPSDGIAMAIAIRSQMITKSCETNVKGDERGAVQTNPELPHNAVLVQDFNVITLKDLLLQYLS